MAETLVCKSCGCIYASDEAHVCPEDSAKLQRVEKPALVPSHEDQIAQRVAEVGANWPTLDSAWGCVNCRVIFAQLDNARCPHCRSEQCFDVAKAIGKRAITGSDLAPLVELLNQVIE